MGSWWGGDEDEGRPEYRTPAQRGGGRRKLPDLGHSIPGVEVVRATEAAILVRGRGVASDPFGMDDETEEAWIPRSQVHEDSVDVTANAEVGDRGTLLVTTWIAQQKKLI